MIETQRFNFTLDAKNRSGIASIGLPGIVEQKTDIGKRIERTT
jgi:hypothetical protein